MSPETHDSELTALEATLAALAPTPGTIDRDQLLFRAGQASVPRRGWFWPSTALALALLASTLEVGLALRPEPRVVSRTVFVPIEAPSLPAQPVMDYRSDMSESAPAETQSPEPSPLSYYRLEQLALRVGLEALPDSSAGTLAERSRKPDTVLNLYDTKSILELETP